MRTNSVHAFTEAFEAHEQRVADHLRDAEVRRALGTPDLRARVASGLRALAERLEPRPAPHSVPAHPTCASGATCTLS